MKRKAKTERNCPDSPGKKETFNNLIALMKEFISSNTALGYTPPKKGAHISTVDFNNMAVLSMKSDSVTVELHP